MLRFLISMLIFLSYDANANTDYSCILKNSCDDGVVKTIVTLLKWDDVLEYFDGFNFAVPPMRSRDYHENYAASFSNGSLSALLFVSKNNNTVNVISAIDVANHNELKICNINNDDNDDICFTAFPTGTNIKPYQAKYIQQDRKFTNAL